MRQMHICREGRIEGEEGNSGTSEHANPVLRREKKASLLQIKIWLQAGKTFSCERGEERGQTNGALLPCQHFEIPGFTPILDQTVKTTEEWIKSCQCFLCRTSNRNMALGKKFLLRPAASPWKLFQPQLDVDDKRDFVEPK